MDDSQKLKKQCFLHTHWRISCGRKWHFLAEDRSFYCIQADLVQSNGFRLTFISKVWRKNNNVLPQKLKFIFSKLLLGMEKPEAVLDKYLCCSTFLWSLHRAPGCCGREALPKPIRACWLKSGAANLLFTS